jgi:hypothetical protein
MYRRSAVDPFCSISPEPEWQEWRDEIRRLSGEGLQDALTRDDTIEASEFGVDLLYSDFFDRKDTLASAQAALSLLKEARSSVEKGSVREIAIKMREIDVAELATFAAHAAVSGRLSGEERVVAENARAAAAQRSILAGVSLLERANELVASCENNTEKADRIGQLFELFVTTNERRIIYNNETYDQRCAIGSTVMQDQATIVFAPNRHSFDALIVDDTRSVLELLQCKASANQGTDGDAREIEKKKYHEKITPVHGEAFSRFLKDPSRYIRALRAAAENRPDIPEELVRRAVHEVELLLPSRRRAVREILGAALAGSP